MQYVLCVIQCRLFLSSCLASKYNTKLSPRLGFLTSTTVDFTFRDVTPCSGGKKYRPFGEASVNLYHTAMRHIRQDRNLERVTC